MSLEMLVGLNVVDDEGYSSYRKEMTPLLEEHGGSFGYDFRVSEVLHTATQAPINRVFTLCFPDEEARAAFFSNPAYLDVRRRHFDRSVADTTRIAIYSRDLS